MTTRGVRRGRLDDAALSIADLLALVPGDASLRAGTYDNPEQDLNELWWDLVEKYQVLKPPEGRNAPDYASKIHIVSAPCYYHNYMMGEFFASQLHHAIARDVLAGSISEGDLRRQARPSATSCEAKVFDPG